MTMPTYTTIEIVPDKLFFRCDKQRATLSTDSCAEMWRRADELQDGSYSACMRCPVGAVHAGEVAASMSPLKGTLTCARCHRGSTRLVGAHVCPSCYNRALELSKGRNAKGTKPVKLARLDSRVIHFQHGDEIRHRTLGQSIDTDELIVAVLRDSKKRVRFTYDSTPPSTMPQKRLW